MEKGMADQLDDRTAAEIAALFESLSDPTRVRIIACLMDGETNVGELVQTVGLSKSAISHQLRSLRDKRVIRSRRQGRFIFVALDDEHITELFHQGLNHVLHR